MIVGCGDLTILLLGLGFHCFFIYEKKNCVTALAGHRAAILFNSSLQNLPKIQSVHKSMILRTGFCVFTAFFFVYELFGVKKLVFGWGIERAGIEMREVDKCFDWRNNLYMIV